MELAKKYTNIIPTKIQTENILQTTLNQPAKSGCCSGNNQVKETRGGCCGGNGGCHKEQAEDEGSDEEDETNILPPSVPLENVKELEAEKKKGGRYFELPSGIAIDACSIFFIGKESLTLTNIMMVHNKCPVSYQL
jgi:diphthamide biosynthesis protein 2